MHGDVKFVQECIDIFKEVLVALAETITEKLPKCLQRAEPLPADAERLKDSCKGEIEALSALNKGKAVLALGKNVT